MLPREWEAGAKPVAKANKDARERVEGRPGLRVRRASLSADEDPYAAQFAALGSMTSQGEADDAQASSSTSSTPDASAAGGISSKNRCMYLVVAIRTSAIRALTKHIPRESCIKARTKLGDNVVHFRPGDRVITLETLNAQLLSARCIHCKEAGCLIIYPPPEEKRRFFRIVKAVMSVLVSGFASHLKLRCGSCEGHCWARFFVAPDLDSVRTSWA